MSAPTIAVDDSVSYGTVAWMDAEKPEWMIETQPHVAMRLKRVFPAIRERSFGRFRLVDTLDHARDLNWFLQRYPHELRENAAVRLLAQTRAHRERESVVSRLLQGSVSTLNFPLAVLVRDYQVVAAQMWLAVGGLILADDVGLGKSASSIAALVDPAMRPALVVAYPHLGPQWRKFFAKFAPHLHTHIVKKSQPYDLRKPLTGEIPDVIIMSYHKLSSWADTLAPVLKSVVFDECQELRHSESQKYRAAQKLAYMVGHRIGLSATPIYNYGSEIYNVVNITSPGALGSYSEFVNEWCGGYGDKVKDPKALGDYMRVAGLMLRRTRAEVGRELPKCQTIPHPIEADARHFEEAATGCENLAQIILQSSEQFKGQKWEAAREFDIRMRQATGISKAPYVAEFVRMLCESGEKVVLYGWHRSVYDIWRERLAEMNPVLYTGSESPTQKEESKRAFVEGDSRVMMISLRAGAGLDGLQDVCSTVVFGELDWSPGVHEQCIGRVHRDGQQKPVFAYYLLADAGSDPVIADTLGIKSQQIEGIRNPRAELLEKLEVDPNHIRKLAEAYLARRKGR